MAISILARIFWAICIKRSIIPWFERVPGKINIADFPTRFAKLPYRLRSFRELTFRNNLFRMIRTGLRAGAHGFFDPTDLVGSFY